MQKAFIPTSSAIVEYENPPVQQQMASASPAEQQPQADASGAPQRAKHVITYSFWTQFKALFVKSFIYQKRQYGTNICQASFPVLLLVLLFVIQLLVTSIVQDELGAVTPAIRNPQLEAAYYGIGTENQDSCTRGTIFNYGSRVVIGANLGDPSVTSLGSFPKNFSNGLPSAPNPGSGVLGKVVLQNAATPNPGLLARIATKTPNRGPTEWCEEQAIIVPTLESEVLPDVAATNTKVYDLWSKMVAVLTGWTFSNMLVNSTSGGMNVRFTVLTNDSFSEHLDVPAASNMISNAVFRSVCAQTTACASDPLGGELTYVGRKQYPAPAEENDFDIVSVIGPTLFLYVLQLLLPVFLGNLVTEKEFKLKEIMKMMGLKEHIYVISTYLFNLILYAIAMTLMWLVAWAMGFRYFIDNSFGAIFLLLFIWGNLMIAMAFLASTCFTSSRTATVVSYLYVFVTGILATSLIVSFFDDDSTPTVSIFFIMCVPSFALFRGLSTLRDGVAFDATGLVFSDIGSAPWEHLSQSYAYMVIEWFIFGLLYFYITNIPPPLGRFPDLIYVFRPSYWRSHSVADEGGEKAVFVPRDDMPPDVIEAGKHAVDFTDNPVIRILGLHKRFGPKIAVKQLHLSIYQNECFGFLGPNGAGKSTTLNMLCGYLKPSGGAAELAGRSLLSNLDAVHLVMGVCPQDNVLWESLTAGEHLAFYGRMKGLGGKELDQAIDDGLRNVNLFHEKNKRAGAFSGGMKRRLCVAISLIGDPTIVLLDEPTTGLDPDARKQLWTVIKKQKETSCMMLTTHSMEEAEVLCDRLGIFAGGELKCIGTSSDLKRRFQLAYKLTFTSHLLEAEATQRLKAWQVHEPGPVETMLSNFVVGLAPHAVLLNSIAGTQNWELPVNEVRLSEVFRVMEQPATKQALGLLDWGICNTTLEEVFVRIATQGIESMNAQKQAEAAPTPLRTPPSTSGSHEAAQNSVILHVADAPRHIAG